jgi:RNA polymerase primary sigma factor
VLAAQRDEAGAREQLIKTFLPLIGGVARIYRCSAAVEHGELMQEGIVGLLRALGRYDGSLDTPFWAYAAWWVRQAMQRLVAELGRPVVLSDRALRQLACLKDAHRELVQAHGRQPSTAELATATRFSRRQIEGLVAVERTPRALEESVGSEEGTVATFGELLADTRVEEEFERVVWRLESERLSGLPDRLGDRERNILRARYGLDGPEQTLREIAARLGLSAEGVRQIEQRALAKLRTVAGVVDAKAELDGADSPKRVSADGVDRHAWIDDPLGCPASSPPASSQARAPGEWPGPRPPTE